MEFAADGSTIETLFAPEVLLPAQYSAQRSDELAPERRLMLAVLLDAVRCYQTYCRTRRRADAGDYLEANAWLFVAANRGPFSCEVICEVLGIELAELRRLLLKWRGLLRSGETVPRFRRAPVVPGSSVLKAKRHQKRRGQSGPAFAAAVLISTQSSSARSNRADTLRTV